MKRLTHRQKGQPYIKGEGIMNHFVFGTVAEFVKCPHCGYSGEPDVFNPDAYSHGDEEQFRGTCPECGKSFIICIEDETIRYYGTKLDQ